MRRAIRIASVGITALALLACDSPEAGWLPQAPWVVAEARAAEAPVSGNLLVNPGFEAGREGWSWRESSPYWSDFEIVEGTAHTGSRAVHLALRQTERDPWRAARIWGVVQEPSLEQFPTRIGGYYRVERWDKQDEATDLYLQVAVIVWGDPRTATLVNPLRPDARLRNYQIRYYLAGQSEPAFPVSNAKVEIVSGERPPLGEWVHFELPVKEDFKRLWGVVPEGFDSIRVLFEARWDNLPTGTTVHADVYYDDLYLVIPPKAP